MEMYKAPTRERRKNSERRKEKSRDAARSRRGKESEIFSELASVLPLPQNVVSHLDKASVMRLIITKLRLINVLKSISIEEENEDELNKYDNLYLKAAGGFIIVLSVDGDITFVSQNVNHYLGISQVDVLGQNVLDIAHPCDHAEIREVLSGKATADKTKTFFIRMKCVTTKGRGINTKSPSYKVLHVVGKFVKMADSEEYSFIAIATPIPHPTYIEMPLGKFTFLSQHSLDMKFTFADGRMNDFLGYNPENLLGKSVFDFHHAQDNKIVEKAFRVLFLKGQSDTGEYRFLAQGGGYVWISTQATVIFGEKNNKPESVVCVNYVISEKCEEGNIYTSDQLEGANQKQAVSSTENSIVDAKLSVPCQEPTASPVKTSECSNPKPRPATVSIFAPRTADMITDFLPSSDSGPGSTSITDDSDDLTHLAPTAGDTCVSLETPLINDFLPIFSASDEIEYPLMNSERDVSLFSTCRDECSDSCQSPSWTQSPESSDGSLDILGGESASFENASLKPWLGIYSNEDELSFKQYDFSFGDEKLPLLLPTDIQWDYPVVDPDTTPLGSFASMDAKTEESLAEFEQFLQSHGRSNLLPCQMDVDSDSRKRGSPIIQDGVKKRKHQNVQDPEGGGSSVLMNLLVAGCDLNAGYTCYETRRSHTGKSGS